MTTRKRTQHHRATHEDIGISTFEAPSPDDKLLTIAEVAGILRTLVASLRYWRHLGTGPRNFRVGRGIRYRHSDVVVWLQDQEQIDNVGAHASSSRH